jgi:hypothetical protein
MPTSQTKFRSSLILGLATRGQNRKHTWLGHQGAKTKNTKNAITRGLMVGSLGTVYISTKFQLDLTSSPLGKHTLESIFITTVPELITISLSIITCQKLQSRSLM